MATSTQIESLKKALSYDRPPLCSGAISPPPEGFYLYYGKDDPRFINFASSTPEQLDQLAAACDRATFGHGNKDVYDESYRKALKMDTTGFAAQFDPTHSSLIKTIEGNLLQGQREKMSIRPEIYKLNVYGKGSFFKAHKDTPRGTNMLGSLVIVYPTPHQGGELVLRHKDREWTLDANALTSSESTPSLAYIAFYSDIEHEVLKVTSGFRVTLTYNLYLVPHNPTSQAPASSDPSPASIQPNLKGSTNFQTMLRRLLQSPEFMPEGGTLAFNLAHLYPVTFHTNLQEVIEYLKGEDAHVYQSCQELELEPTLRMIYCRKFWDNSLPDWGIMMEVIIQNPSYDWERSDYESHLVEELNGIPVNLSDDIQAKYSTWNESDLTDDFEQLTWLTEFSESGNELKDVALAYGNEVTVDSVYCRPCLIVRVDSASDRV